VQVSDKTAVLSTNLAAAREAYLRGDFIAVLAQLGDAPLGPAATLESRLIRARALLKLHRPEDVLAEFREPDLVEIPTVDERITACMLHGAALARIDLPRGIVRLQAVAVSAHTDRAHPSLCAEVAYFRAVAYWSIGDLKSAERLAMEAEQRGRDVLVVRATQLRAFIAAAKDEPNRYTNALALFQAAARLYASCRERDVDLATIIVEQIASLEQTTRSARLTGCHGAARGPRTLPGSFFGPAVPSATRLRIWCNDAWLLALDGADAAAFRVMREAEDNAPTPAWRVWALAGRAAIAVVCGERAAARTFADQAVEYATSVLWSDTRDEERTTFLQLAEVFSYLEDGEAASDALTRFDGHWAPMDNTRVLRDNLRDPRLHGWIEHVRGLVRRLRGDTLSAGKNFAAAAASFRACGYLWREALSLIELDATSGRGAAGADLDRAVALIREHFPQSFLARRLGPWTRAHVDPLIGQLSPAEREVLRHLLDGRTQKEIAKVTGRAYNTVRAHTQSLHRKLRTNSERDLVVMCARRGIGAPSWSFASLSHTAGRSSA